MKTMLSETKKVFNNLNGCTPTLKDAINGCFYQVITGTKVSAKGTFVAYEVTKRISAYMGRIFWKTTDIKSFCVNASKAWGESSLIPILIEASNIDWLEGTEMKLLTKYYKVFFPSIISGKITNPEDLYKAFNKKYFKGVFQWKTLREYFNIHTSISLWDIYGYSTNPQEALKVVIETSSDNFCNNSYYQLLYDTLTYARYLNQKINFSWSLRRFQEEHQKQIFLDQREEINKIPDIQRVKPFEYEGIKLITTDRECYENSLLMNNCTYRCYWQKVQEGRYLLAKGNGPSGPFNVGFNINIDNHSMHIDQVKLSYNREPDCNTEKLCAEFINELVASDYFTKYWFGQNVWKR